MEFKPHEYQKRMIQKVIEMSHIGLFLDMGLGKSVITLTALKSLFYDFSISRALVIAPKRVAEDTWSRECEKWDHLRGIRVSKVLGSRRDRERALEADADVYVIGRDNTKWLVEHYRRKFPFDVVVIDELSSFKNPQSERFRALRKVIAGVGRVIGLTGTPSPNGLIDLWAQVYLLDQGERLGRTLGKYRAQYFTPGASNGHVVYKWNLKRGAAEKIKDSISDICISMSAKDYLKLPGRIDNEIRIKLSTEDMASYKQMEEDQLIRIEDSTVVALSAAAVMTKLLQMANGAVYSDDGTVIKVHTWKADALAEIVDTSESPVLVFYSYRHDLAAIREKVKGARALERPEDITDWNNGKIRVLLAHPASVGYGLNLQDGGNVIVWYGLTWSLEQYQQANARLHRQGQTKPVIIHHLIAEGTVDEQVMKALKHKDTSQSALLEALKERKDE